MTIAGNLKHWSEQRKGLYLNFGLANELTFICFSVEIKHKELVLMINTYLYKPKLCTPDNFKENFDVHCSVN